MGFSAFFLKNILGFSAFFPKNILGFSEISYFCSVNPIQNIMVFKRKLYQAMLRWKQERQGRTALLIEGARRVGKSTLVEEFAKKEYKTYILIDFANVSKTINALFDDISDLDYFFLRLQNETGVTLHRRQSVVVFDEVQLQPLARQAIKYLVKDGRYDYIETGSLLSIKKNIQNILIPSEETRLTLHPMDFEEFLWATGNASGLDFLRVFWEKKLPLAQAHRKQMRDLRIYMLVGGMPQAVATYLDKNNLQSVDETKREILALYESDFHRIDTTGRASRLFRAIPSQLNSNASRYQVSSVIEGQDVDRVADVVAAMEDSKSVTLAYHATDPNEGMNMFSDYRRYKMFLADTGLFITLAFMDKAFTDNIIYSKLLDDSLKTNLGYVYENLVAQMLSANGNSLYYYTFPSEKGNHNYEVDFLISRGNKICPIEVKSSSYRTHASLDAFCSKFSAHIGERYLLYTKDYQKEGQLQYVPVYMTGLL